MLLGLDILGATGTPPSACILADAVSVQIAGGTYSLMTLSPTYVQSIQAKRPATFPGTQTFLAPGWQSLCRAASNLHRGYCWPSNHTYTVFDLALMAVDEDPLVGIGARFAGYYMLVRNVISVNNYLLSLACVIAQGRAAIILLVSNSILPTISY